jgi:hypothetical protein
MKTSSALASTREGATPERLECKIIDGAVVVCVRHQPLVEPRLQS